MTNPDDFIARLNAALKDHPSLGPIAWKNKAEGSLHMRVQEIDGATALQRLQDADPFNQALLTAPRTLTLTIIGPDELPVDLRLTIAGDTIRYVSTKHPGRPPSTTFPAWFSRRFGRGFPLPLPDPGFHRLDEDTWITVPPPATVMGFPQQMRLRDCPDYRLVGYGGHGVNSYAGYYTRVMPRLALYLRLPFGGFYGDPDRDADDLIEKIRSIDAFADELLGLDGEDRIGHLEVILNMGHLRIALQSPHGDFQFEAGFEKHDESLDKIRQAALGHRPAPPTGQITDR